MTHTHAKLFAKCGAYHTPDSHPLFTYNVTVTDDGRPLVTVHGTTEFEAVEYAQTLADRCNGFEALKAENYDLHKTIDYREGQVKTLQAQRDELVAELKRSQDELSSALRDGFQNHFNKDMLQRWLKGVSDVLKNAGAL